MVEAYAQAAATNREQLDTTSSRLKASLWTLLGALSLLGASEGTLLYNAGGI